MATLIVMLAKAPVAGKVKTRLGKSIGMEWSARLHKAFIGDLSDTIASVGFDVLLSYAGDPNHVGFEAPRTRGFTFKAQPSGDLGERLNAICKKAMNDFDRIIIIGSDSPTLEKSHFLDADAALENCDVVIGPSFDGGYYLIGVNKAAFESQGGRLSIFSDIRWSSEEVLDQTLQSCHRSHQRCELLGFWYDVDTVIDLNFLRTHLRQINSVGGESGQRTRALLEEFDRTAK